MTRVLCILRGLVPPRPDAERDQFTYLSQIAEGDVLLPVWWRSPDQARPHLRPTFPTYRRGSFRYHQFLEYRYPRFLRTIVRFIFYIRRGLQLHREKKFDVIHTYGSNLPAIAGVVLKWLTGAKLIVELPNVPENAYRYYDPGEGAKASLKRFFAVLAMHAVCLLSDCIHIVYPWQLHKFPLLRRKRVVIFPSFVPLHTIVQVPSEEKFILLVGSPWYTKGADILIRAFVQIAPQFPSWKLKLLGHVADRSYLENLALGSPQIEFLSARPNAQALGIIGACSIFALASRTDAAPVVVREAMAARKPVIASAVGGIPYFVRHNETGLLFKPQDVNDLAEKLATLLSDPDLRERLAARGHEMIMSEFDETAFVRSFERMLQSVASDARTSTTVSGSEA